MKKAIAMMMRCVLVFAAFSWVDSFCRISTLRLSTKKILLTTAEIKEPMVSMATKHDSEETFETENDEKLQDPKFLARNKHWVIIADDEEDIRMAVGDYLYDQGYQVTACADADTLLEVCSKPRSDRELAPIPDAIIRLVVPFRLWRQKSCRWLIHILNDFAAIFECREKME